MADFNKSGRTDMVMGPDGSVCWWYVLRSTGSAFVDDAEWVTGAYGNGDQSPDRIRVADVNRDGRADFVIGPDGSGCWYILLAKKA